MKAQDLDTKFSPTRLFYLLRNRIIEEAGILGIGLAVVVANNLISLIFAKKVWFNHGMSAWTTVIVLAGLLLAGQAFKAMHDGKSSTEWLLLPASPLEKYCAALLDYLVVFPLAAALVSMGFSALFALLEKAVSGHWTGIWTPFSLETLKEWGSYGIMALVFLAGSSHFRKAAVLKTLAVLTALGLVVVLLLTVGSWAILQGSGKLAMSFGEQGIHLNGGDLPASVQRTLTLLAQIAGCVVLPLFSLGYGYLRVFEKEARDAVQ